MAGPTRNAGPTAFPALFDANMDSKMISVQYQNHLYLIQDLYHA